MVGFAGELQSLADLLSTLASVESAGSDDEGVMTKVFDRLLEEDLMQVKSQLLALDSNSVKVLPDGTGAPKTWSPSHRKVPRRSQHQDAPDGGR